mmetsp:Transcript_53878/g.165784  ORF Transcript_53878/g.165784 Transcript_53878/m.165784 type:complete len:82 (+) Transcript_53878:80-325(+)
MIRMVKRLPRAGLRVVFLGLLRRWRCRLGIVAGRRWRCGFDVLVLLRLRVVFADLNTVVRSGCTILGAVGAVGIGFSRLLG